MMIVLIFAQKSNPHSPKIVEANGDVIFVAQAPTVNPIPVFSCHAY